MTKTKLTAEGVADTTDGAGTERETVFVDEAQIAAARLKITLDRKFGRKTPDIIKKIAAVDYRP